MNRQQSLANQQALSPYKQAIARYVRSAMELNGVRYTDLADAMSERGITITPENLRSKVSKCLFSADVLLVILEILQVEDSAIVDILKLASNLRATP